jgi:hypothetical protein
MNVDRFIPIVKANLVLLDQDYSVEEVGRILMLSYGDVDTKASGLVSENLVNHHEPTNTYYRKGKYTEEHFITRTNTCRQVCNAYLEGKLTDDLLYSLLDLGRTVHYTTEDDNIKLRKYQQDVENYPTWESQYEAAGINLVEDPGMFGNSKYYYEIDGKVYKNVNEAAEGEGVITATIKNRSFNSKFPNYVELEYAL